MAREGDDRRRGPPLLRPRRPRLRRHRARRGRRRQGGSHRRGRLHDRAGARPQPPTRYDPLAHPRRARARRNDVLRALRATGDISQATYLAAIRRPLYLKPGKRYTAIEHPNFVSYVEQVLIRRYGAKTVEDGGLRVRTTLDPRLQLLAVRAIQGVLREPTDPAAALVA